MESLRKEVVTLGGGCFWCLEAVFDQVRGVDSVTSGYSGGSRVGPSYQDVCAGDTGHAEVVQIVFNPQAISFRQILEIYFTIHDPTTPNRQGADVGTQYRSVIFYHSPEQQQTALEVIAIMNAAGIWDRPIVTQVVPFEKFYRAEEYHQGYYCANSAQPYCTVVIFPKVAKLRKQFSARLKS